MFRTCTLAATLLLAGPVYAQEHAHPPAQAAAPAPQTHDHAPAPQPEQPPQQTHDGDHHPMHDGQMQHGQMQHGQMHHEMHQGPDEHAGHDMGATGSALGAYPTGRDASGTSWQPDVAEHGGVHAMAGDWMLMGHVLLNGVTDWQDGPQGDEKTFLAGMIMGAARRDFSNGGALNLRAMLAPDPLMGKRGYPLTFASGETADGVEPLVDRQHPHDLFMELSASYSHRLSATDSVFVYAGLPGEPAFGPPAFMHRLTAMDSPEAPITHHWLDSTHITFGVLTAGYVHDNMKLEVSRFRGREPDEERYDIETGALDSTAVRASWNPTQNWSLQISWADVTSPEQLAPDEDETRWSASAIYARPVFDGHWAITGALARKERSDGVDLDAWLVEAALKPNDAWTFFGRVEDIQSDELGGDHHGPVEDFTKASLGAIHDWRVHENAAIGLGGLVSYNWAPDALNARYGGDQPGAMAFVRLKIG
ncbi:MAG: hypothetical protein JNJ73_05385 [Hyphomonadaceae bacterium]|nr:hypothetical protein [Hyphomonadaceae bacterium]